MHEVVLTSPRRAARLAFEAVNTHPHPTMRSLADDIATATGKPLDIREIADLGRWGAAALWMDMGDRHLVLESAPTSAHHQHWVRAHEFGHIVFAHLGWTSPPAHADLHARTGPDVDAAVHQHRVDFRRPAEQAAEEFARFTDTLIRRALGGTLDNNYLVALG